MERIDLKAEVVDEKLKWSATTKLPGVEAPQTYEVKTGLEIALIKKINEMVDRLESKK